MRYAAVCVLAALPVGISAICGGQECSALFIPFHSIRPRCKDIDDTDAVTQMKTHPDIPWQVTVFEQQRTAEDTKSCDAGGILLSPKHVLVDAHMFCEHSPIADSENECKELDVNKMEEIRAGSAKYESPFQCEELEQKVRSLEEMVCQNGGCRTWSVSAVDTNDDGVDGCAGTVVDGRLVLSAEHSCKTNSKLFVFENPEWKCDKLTVHYGVLNEEGEESTSLTLYADSIYWDYMYYLSGDGYSRGAAVMTGVAPSQNTQHRAAAMVSVFTATAIGVVGVAVGAALGRVWNKPRSTMDEGMPQGDEETAPQQVQQVQQLTL